VGGGIKTLADVALLVAAGAEKVSINTAAVVDEQIVAATANKFGRCATVVNIDPRRVPASEFDARRRPASGRTESRQRPGTVFEVFIHGGRTPTGLDPVSYAERVVALGAGEIVLTSMDGDGTKDGFDIEITRLVSSAVDVPLVASGGAGCGRHMVEVLQQTRADAVLAASIFHFGECSIAEVKAEMAAAGLPVRR
jgi:cyclase